MAIGKNNYNWKRNRKKIIICLSEYNFIKEANSSNWGLQKLPQLVIFQTKRATIQPPSDWLTGSENTVRHDTLDPSLESQWAGLGQSEYLSKTTKLIIA